MSPGATGTDLQPIRESTKCVCPATNGPAPKVVSTLLWSWMPVAKYVRVPICVHVSMSALLSASTLGAPVVPLVWYTRLTCAGVTQRLLPKGGASSIAGLSSALLLNGSRAMSLRESRSPVTPASRNLRE